MINTDISIEPLIEQNQLLIEQNMELQRKVQQLEEKITRLERNSSNSSKPPSSDIVAPKPPAQRGRKRKHLLAFNPARKTVKAYLYSLNYPSQQITITAGFLENYMI